MSALFKNRTHAGRFLADKLEHRQNDPALLVLALPRGGVPVGNEIARRLQAPLDVFVVRKLGVPGHDEFAFGALASGGVCFVSQETTTQLGITPEVIRAIVEDEKVELQRRERLYRGNRPPPEIRGRQIILVDDGLATGATMRAAVHALRAHQPASITVAVPVGAPDTCRYFESEVDEILCAHSHEPFIAIGKWYEDFQQMSDEEVLSMLDHHAHEQKVREVQQRHPEL